MLDPTISWFEIRVPDVTRAQKFYTEVFGLTAQPWDQYVMLVDGEGRPRFALEQTTDTVAPDGYLRSYLNSDDLEGDLARIERAGGRVERPRGLISEEFGWWALARDPFGNWLGLCTSAPPAG